jgi:hypothetical protein
MDPRLYIKGANDCANIRSSVMEPLGRAHDDELAKQTQLLFIETKLTLQNGEDREYGLAVGIIQNTDQPQ